MDHFFSDLARHPAQTLAALCVLAGILTMASSHVHGEEQEDDLVAAWTAEQPPANEPDSEMDALRQRLMEGLRETPVIAPTREEIIRTVPARLGVPATVVEREAALATGEPDALGMASFREGQFISAQRGRVRFTSTGRAIFILDSGPEGQGAEPPLVIQPNGPLEVLETALLHHGLDTPVMASGQIHHHRGISYLLLSHATYPDLDDVITLEGARRDPLETDATAAQEDESADPKPAPATALTPPQMVRGVFLTDEDLSTAPNAGERTPRRDGHFLVMRQARLVRSPVTGQPLLVLEADSTREGLETPLAVLPSAALARMEDQWAVADIEPVFLVSGQVHVYRGHHYLIATQTMAPRPGDNLNRPR